MKGILNKIYRAQHKDIYKLLYDKVLNLASDPKEHFNLGLHITQTNNKYWLANGISHSLPYTYLLGVAFNGASN